MKKRIYQAPKMELMQVEAESQLLTASIGLHDMVSNGAQLSNEESDFNVWGE